MKVGDLVKMKKNSLWSRARAQQPNSAVGVVVDIIKQVDPCGSIRVLWSDGVGKTLEFPNTLELVQ